MPRRVRTDAGMQLAGAGGATPSIIAVQPVPQGAGTAGAEKGLRFDDAAPVNVPVVLVGYNFTSAVALTVEDPMGAGTTWNVTNLVVTEPTASAPGSLAFTLDSNGVNPVVGSYNFRIQEDGAADIIGLLVAPAA